MRDTCDEPISDIRKTWLGCRELCKPLGALVGYLMTGQMITDVVDSYLHNRGWGVAIAAVSTIALFGATQRRLFRSFGWDLDPEPMPPPPWSRAYREKARAYREQVKRITKPQPMPPAPWTRAYRDKLRAYHDHQKRISEMHCPK